MSLKKTDKIIAIIGVLILIIAGIGIFLYVGTEEATSSEPTEGNMYEVTWERHTATMQQTGTLGKKGAYTEPFDVSAQGGVLTNVVVYFVWKDTKTYGLKDKVNVGLRKKGQDTLTAVITLVGGEAQTHKSVGSADNTTDPKMFTINSAPQDEEITDASSIEEAKQIVMDKYPNKDKASFETKITLKVGEKLLRPLKYMMEQGDKFTMNIEYTYYTLGEVSFESPPPEEQAGTDGGESYYQQSLGEI